MASYDSDYQKTSMNIIFLLEESHRFIIFHNFFVGDRQTARQSTPLPTQTVRPETNMCSLDNTVSTVRDSGHHLSQMASTSVLYVYRRDAKAIKSQLEEASLLDKRFRMLPTTSDAVVNSNDGVDTTSVKDDIISGICIAVPVTNECTEMYHQYSNTEQPSPPIWTTRVVASGMHICPFSTSTLGNSNRRPVSSDVNNASNDASSKYVSLNNVQYALVETILSFCTSEIESATHRTTIDKAVLALSLQTCPKKLEVIGDDRTLVVPRYALFLVDDQREATTTALNVLNKGSNEFYDLLISTKPQNYTLQSLYTMQSKLWENLARVYQSSRVVRRGDIYPDSGVRESGASTIVVLCMRHNQIEAKCFEHILYDETKGVTYAHCFRC